MSLPLLWAPGDPCLVDGERAVLRRMDGGLYEVQLERDACERRIVPRAKLGLRLPPWVARERGGMS